MLALTTFDDDDHLYPALAAGACGFPGQGRPPGELLDGIRGAAAGDRPFSQSPLRRLVDQAAAGHQAPPAVPALPSSLTEREHEVLALVGRGAVEQGDRGAAVYRHHHGQEHVASLMAKTGCQNRIGLAVLANRAGR